MNKERSKTPLYQVVYSELKSELLSGKYAAGDSFPPERGLKERFGVSHLTVRKALGMLTDEGFLRRGSGRATTVIYQGEGVPASGAFDALSVIVEDADDFFSVILNSLEDSCRKKDLDLRFYRHVNDPELARSQYMRAAERDDSILLFFPAHPLCDWLKFHPALSRTIVADQVIEGLNAPQVISDDVTGMRNMVRHLIDLGHRRIAHINAESKTSGRDRLFGYKKALDEAGLPFDSILVENGNFQIESSALAFERIFQDAPDVTACVCANDYSAFGVMKAARKLGLEIGGDLAVAGYGNYPISDALELTSVDQRTDVICSQIICLMDDLLNRGRPASNIRKVPTELRPRNSTFSSN